LGIIDNLYEYKSKNFGEVRDMVINMLISNIDTATAIVYNDVYIPILLRQIIHENKDDYKVLFKNYDEWRLNENIFKEIY
jgi:hypothetical protein